MTSISKKAAVAVAIVLLSVVGLAIAFRPGGSNVAGPGASPPATPNPTPSPTPIPSPALMPDGSLAAGDYVLQFPDNTVTAIVTAPKGWTGYASFGLGKDGLVGEVSEIGLVTGAPTGLYPDPCHWKPGTDKSKNAVLVGPTVDDLVAAIVGSPHLAAGKPAAITVDGYVGKQIEVRLPSDVDFSTCDDGYWYPFATDAQMIRAQGPGNIWNMLVLDVAGSRIVVMDEHFDGTPAAAKAETQAILDSVQIVP